MRGGWHIRPVGGSLPLGMMAWHGWMEDVDVDSMYIHTTYEENLWRYDICTSEKPRWINKFPHPPPVVIVVVPCNPPPPVAAAAAAAVVVFDQ